MRVISARTVSATVFGAATAAGLRGKLNAGQCRLLLGMAGNMSGLTSWRRDSEHVQKHLSSEHDCSHGTGLLLCWCMRVDRVGISLDGTDNFFDAFIRMPILQV